VLFVTADCLYLYKESVLRLFTPPINKRGVVLLTVETLILITSFYLGVTVRFSQNHELLPEFSSVLPQAIIFTLVMITSMKAMGMYQLIYLEDFRHTLLRLMPSFALGFGLITLIFYVAPSAYFGRGILFIVMVFATIGMSLVRYTLITGSGLNFLKPKIMVLGRGELAKECADIAEHNNSQHQFNIAGFVPINGEKSIAITSKIMPPHQPLLSLARTYQIDEIVVAIQNRDNMHFPVQELLDCKLSGITVIGASTFFEREMNQIRVNSLNPSWLVFGGGFDQSNLRTAIKRLFDLCSSAILLIITLPIMLIAALCIYLEDRAPILYGQERIGLDGHPFTVYKFRSMRQDAEISGKPQWATENDTRITRVGRIIRKLRIDELPQVFNVLKGEMSLVGPRPERDFFVKQLCAAIPYYNLRHSIKPGITGWAQVRYQYGSSVEDSLQKLQYDLYYVKNNSLFLDIIILMDTVLVVLTGKGSR